LNVTESKGIEGKGIEGKGKEREERKKDAAPSAAALDLKPPDPEADLFRRGKEVCGKSSGGLIKQVLQAKKGNIPLARAAIEQASTKASPREYLGAIVRGSSDEHALRQPYWDPAL
jgi:hypothetical protein